MVDIETHQIIDMIDSRDTRDVTRWLKEFPNLEIVSRDGSVSYRKAITDANKNIIQISDRFHLLKGLTDAAKKYIMRLLGANIGLPVSSSHYDGTGTSDYWNRACMDDLPEKRHKRNLEQKMMLVEKARELRRNGYSLTMIQKELDICYGSLKRYLREDYNPVNGNYNTKHPSKIKPYADEIIHMLHKGMTFQKIEESIRKKGYDGASSTIRMFTTRERKLMKEAKTGQNTPVEKIERKWLISLLYKPVDQVIGISEQQLDKVIEIYPEIGRVYDVVAGFKQVLFSKKPSELDKWMEEARNLEIDEITSFVNGTSQDQAAVKKAVELEHNNGLAEGSVNKLKTIKRIMYGRSKFAMLKGKILWRNLYR